MLREVALQVDFFTKEFAGYEIESKWELRGMTPVPMLLQFVEDIKNKKWAPFKVAKAMGVLKTGVRLLEFDFHFFGTKEGERWHQVAMVAQDSMGRSMVAFKDDGKRFFPDLIDHPPLVRKESRKGDWVTDEDAKKQILNQKPNARYVGTMKREKCSVYITSEKSYRNFNISADSCYSGGRPPLSQIELEYKGRNGVWLPDVLGMDILEDFRLIHQILAENYKDRASPTFRRKFDWIIGQ